MQFSITWYRMMRSLQFGLHQRWYLQVDLEQREKARRQNQPWVREPALLQYSTVVDNNPHHHEVLGLNPARHWTFFFSFPSLVKCPELSTSWRCILMCDVTQKKMVIMQPGTTHDLLLVQFGYKYLKQLRQGQQSRPLWLHFPLYRNFFLFLLT